MVLSIFLSRILGFLREWVLARTVGASEMADVYLASFTIPDFLNYLMAAGALNISLIPILASYAGEGSEQTGKKVYQNLSTILGSAMLLLVVVCQFFSQNLASWVAPGFSPEQIQSLAQLMQLILPAQFFFFWGGMANGVQQTHGVFIYSAIAPLIYNLSIVLIGLLLYPKMGVASFSLGVLLGAFLSYGVLQLWGLMQLGYPILPKIHWDSESRAALKKYLWMSIPIMLAFSLVVADEWISKYLASFMKTGAVSRLSYARTEMRIPIAIIGQAAGIASYPHLSKLWAKANYHDFGQTFIRELQKIWALGPIAAVLMFTHALPITDFIYGGGKLTPDDLKETAELLQLMGLGVVFWIFHILLSRGFYATQTTWLPSLWGTLTTLIFIPVYVKLSQIWGVHGLALSGTLGIAFYVATLSWLLGRHLKKHQASVSFKPFWRFIFEWSLVICLFGLISFGFSRLHIYQSTRLSALADILLPFITLMGLAIFLLRKPFANKTMGGALF
ncbi:MAG: murein biosynthesis integral membrane protein MurJ [Pseudomonadota bacterium]